MGLRGPGAVTRKCQPRIDEAAPQTGVCHRNVTGAINGRLVRASKRDGGEARDFSPPDWRAPQSEDGILGDSICQ